MMTAILSEDTAMLSKCLEFCQVLVSKGQKFSFSLTTSSTFSFSLDTRKESTTLEPSKVNNLQEKVFKKKLSPSQVRRNIKRKEDFLKRKFSEEFPFVKCDKCGKIFKSETDLKNHMDNEHLKQDFTDNIVQLDGNDDIDKLKEDNNEKDITSTFKFVSEMTEEERNVHERKQVEQAKADGSWCYQCKDLFMNKIVLKRHMHNDHNIEVHPDINIMLHGGWMQ